MWFILSRDQNFSTVDIKSFTEWDDVLKFFEHAHNCDNFQVCELNAFKTKKIEEKLLKFSYDELEDFVDKSTNVICVTKNFRKLFKIGDLCKFSEKYGMRFVSKVDDPSVDFIATSDICQNIITVLGEPVINMVKYSPSWSIKGFIPNLGCCYINCSDIEIIQQNE